MDAANNWDQITVTGRSYLAVALSAATLIGSAMAWTCWPTALAVMDPKVPSGDRFQILFAYGALILGPLIGWGVWRRRRYAFTVGLLVVFGLAVGAMLPFASG